MKQGLILLSLAVGLALAPALSAKELTRVEVVPKKKTIVAGQLFNLKAFAHFDDGTRKIVTFDGQWKVDKTLILDGDQWGFMSLSQGTARIQQVTHPPTDGMYQSDRNSGTTG